MTSIAIVVAVLLTGTTLSTSLLVYEGLKEEEEKICSHKEV